MFGGLLHRMTSLEEYIPDYWRKAPIERHVNKKSLTFMNADSTVNLQLESGNFDRAPYNGYTVLRPKFDNWLARQAVKPGYTNLLDNSFVMQDLKKFKRAPGMLHNDRIFNAYPDLACRLMEDAWG